MSQRKRFTSAHNLIHCFNFAVRLNCLHANLLLLEPNNEIDKQENQKSSYFYYSAK